MKKTLKELRAAYRKIPVKKSVIFWNIVATLILLRMYFHDYDGEFTDFFYLMILGISSIFAFVEVMCGNIRFDFEKQKKSAYPFWFLYVTPFGLISLFGYICYKLVLKFNNWLDSK